MKNSLIEWLKEKITNKTPLGLIVTREIVGKRAKTSENS